MVSIFLNCQSTVHIAHMNKSLVSFTMNAIMVKSQSIQGLKKNIKRMVMINHNIDDEFVRKFK